jgi:hypothetical protein
MPALAVSPLFGMAGAAHDFSRTTAIPHRRMVRPSSMVAKPIIHRRGL